MSKSPQNAIFDLLKHHFIAKTPIYYIKMAQKRHFPNFYIKIRQKRHFWRQNHPHNPQIGDPQRQSHILQPKTPIYSHFDLKNTKSTAKNTHFIAKNTIFYTKICQKCHFCHLKPSKPPT
jgi:hypothetical protein